MDISYIENTVDPDQLASSEAIRSGFTQFSTPVENACFKPESCMGKAKTGEESCGQT